MLVYCALFLGLLAGVYGVFVAGSRYFAQAQDRNALQASVETTVARLCTELRESSSATVTIYPNTSAPDAPNGIIFASPRYPASGRYDRDTATGLPIWHKYIAYYAHDGALYRAELTTPENGTTTAVPCSLTTAEVRDATDIQRRRLGLDVDSFVASLGSVSRLVRIHYAARKQRDALIVATEVSLRN